MNRFFHFLIFLAVVLGSKDFLSSVYDNGDDCYFYEDEGIPGCGCFRHCTCFSHRYDQFPGYSFHSMRYEDFTWHKFMNGILLAKQEAPPSSATLWPFDKFLYNFKNVVIGYTRSQNLCMLSKYLDTIERYQRYIEDQRKENIKYCELNCKDELDRSKQIATINDRTYKAYAVLAHLPSEVINSYKNIVERCRHNERYNLALVYNRGLIGLMEGNIDLAMQDIGAFIEIAHEKNKVI